ncbi:MAG: LCP family protein [Oscillospiraceae bacterium]|nr:LCP family protein [Oscillospiraceae bacterium]
MNNAAEMYLPLPGGRRGSVRRAPADYGGPRSSGEPKRYRSGYSAGMRQAIWPEDFPKNNGAAVKMTAKERRAERKARLANRNFFVRHRAGIAVICAVALLLAGGGVWLNHLYRNPLFGEKEGGAHIGKKIESTPEMREDVAYFLIVGKDDSGAGGLTDCLWIMCYDIKEGGVNVMQIPRDTYVGGDSPDGKINAVYTYPKSVKYCDKCKLELESSDISSDKHKVCGTKVTTKKESNINAIIRVINTRLGLPVDHFVVFDFEGFQRVIDVIGGVDMEMDAPLTISPSFKLKQGMNHLDGYAALSFMRARYVYKDGDIGRQKGQRTFIDALFKKAKGMTLSTMLDLMITCANQDFFQTDLTLEDMKWFAGAIRSLDTEKLSMFTMPGVDDWPEPRAIKKSFYVCDTKQTYEIIRDTMLPYGLPGGKLLTPDMIVFPKPNRASGAPGTTRPVSTESTSSTEPTSSAAKPSGSSSSGSTSAPTESTAEPTAEPTTNPTTEPTTAPTMATTTAPPTDPPPPPPTQTTTDSAFERGQLSVLSGY